MKTFEEFMKEPQTFNHQMLVQAIAALSVHPQFSSNTPDEIWKHLNKTRQLCNGETASILDLDT